MHSFLDFVKATNNCTHSVVGDIHICEVLIEQTSLVGTSESEQIDGEMEFLFLVAAVSGNTMMKVLGRCVFFVHFI